MRPPIIVTLLDLLQVVNECTTSDTEAVATVVYLINSGKVLPCGTFTKRGSPCLHRSASRRNCNIL